jgi:hypothetical protein
MPALDPYYFIEPHIKNYLESHHITGTIGPEMQSDWFGAPYALVQASAKFSINESSGDIMRNLCALFLKNLDRWLNGADRVVWRTLPEVRGMGDEVSIRCRLTAYRSVEHGQPI